MLSSTRSSTPIIHSVQFYDHDDALIQRLRGIIASAVEIGNAILVVATDEHREQLRTALAMSGINSSGLETDGRLRLHDSRSMLERFMVDGLPNRSRFLATVGALVKKAKQTSWNSERGLTVFGEMVSVLWQDGNHAAALKLEELWNELLDDGTFHLHCAYPRYLFGGTRAALGIRAICEGHSHVIGEAA